MSAHTCLLRVLLAMLLVGALMFIDSSSQNILRGFSSGSFSKRSAAFWMKNANKMRPTCDFEFSRIDPTCPRFVDVRFTGPAGSGLGDRFLQMVVGLTYAIHLGAFPLNTDAVMGMDSVHGETYAWIPDFFRFNHINANVTMDTVTREYPGLSIIEHPEQYGATFPDRITALKKECNVLITVDWADCIDNSCYYAIDPPIYNHVHNVLSCWFLHTDRTSLPPLAYNLEWYNVAIHLRTGDITLLDEEKGGGEFFSGLKAELDVVLRQFSVHYYFYANSPNTTSGDFSIPAPRFEFLSEVFTNRDAADGDLLPQRVSFLNNVDMRTTVYHQMNADMIVTTGSSFALVAPTLSTKPVVLFSRMKEGSHFPVYLRPDYALVENNGRILKPTMSELQAQVIMRYAEVHHKLVPYA